MVKKKHILFIVENSSAPDDVRVWSEAISAKEFGYEVTVISPKNERAPAAFERIDGIDIYRHYMPFEANWKYAFFIEYLNALIWEFFLSIRIFIRKPFQIIHSANPPDHVFLIALFFKIFKVKFIFDHHDICPENYLAKFGRKDILYRLLLIMEKLTFETADIVISTNESYKKVAENRGKKDENRVFVVRNGPNMANVKFMKADGKWKKGFDYLVSYVGEIGSQEGIDNLLESASYLFHEKNIKTVKFIIIGTGPHLNHLVSLSKEMQLEYCVHFTGYIPYDDLYEILATSDICVNPEHRNPFTDQSTMIKIMDYMTFGKPTVMFETKEGKVTAGKSAIYVKQNDNVRFAETIVELLYDIKRREEMGQIGFERIETKLNWDVQKNFLFKAYSYLESKSN